jgi:hypothetical protein
VLDLRQNGLVHGSFLKNGDPVRPAALR